MKVVDIVSRVRNSAGDTNAMQFTDAMIYDWINDGIREVALQNNLMQKTATSNLVIGQQDYVLPSDILKLYSIKVDNQKIRIVSMEEFEALNSGDPYSSNPSGSPYQAYIWAGVLKMWPVPDSIKPLAINYIYTPVVLAPGDAGAATAEPAIPQSYHLRLISYCLAQVALQDDDIQKYQIHLNAFNEGTLALADQQNTQEDLYPFMSMSPRDMGSGWEY